MKKEYEQTMTNMLIKTGIQEEIETSVLGPKVTRTINIPVVAPTKEGASDNFGKVYERRDIAEEDAEKSLDLLTVVPLDFSDIQPIADQV